jgi:hypothetical protein
MNEAIASRKVVEFRARPIAQRSDQHAAPVQSQIRW